MPYKVFLVEDEIVTREGIRDNVDWKASGFEFCGEASDGEIAIPLIEAAQPDVVITDIKMPFMDGLQLCKIIRKHMPWVKIIILSGYDEFNYAQTAIKLGVTEYLLKPVSVQDLKAVLSKLMRLLDQERSERESLKLLRNQVEDNLALLREKFLLHLVLGGESSAAAIEQSQQLGLDLIARCYLVLLVKIEFDADSQAINYHEAQQIESIVSGLVNPNADIFFTKKDIEELVLILKGDDIDQIEQEAAFLAGLIVKEVEAKTNNRVSIGIGSSTRRLGDLHRSFTEAIMRVASGWTGMDPEAYRKLDQAALQTYLESGSADHFDAYYDAYILPMTVAALHSPLYKHYILLDIMLSAAQFASDLGASIEQIMPEIDHLDEFLKELKSIDQIRAGVRKVLVSGLAFRDGLGGRDRTVIVHQAKAYIDEHFADADLSLNDVAGQVNFSPSHFSAVFSRETGETFKDYLTQVRMLKAKKLLRTTRLKCAEVAYQCGYNDPHYFSVIFKKAFGVSPQRFRDSAKSS